MKRIKILFDGRFVNSDGIGRYTKEILKNLQNSQAIIPFAISRQPNAIFKKIINFHDKSSSYSPCELSNLQQAVDIIKPEIIHCLDFRIPLNTSKVKVISTVHDIMRHIEPSLCYTDKEFVDKIGTANFNECEKMLTRIEYLEILKRHRNSYSLHHKYYQVLLSHCLSKSNVIIVPSFSVKKDILSWSSCQPSKIHVVHHGTNHLQCEHSNLVKREGFMYVGQNRKHKNIQFLIEGFLRYASIYKNFPKLRLVGSHFSDRIHNLPQYIEFLGYQNDANLSRLMKHSSVLIHIPHYEGFGFTPVEARHFGMKIIASDIPVLRETLGCYPMYINQRNMKSYIDTLRKIDCFQPSNQPNENFEKSWSKVANELIRIYQGL